MRQLVRVVGLLLFLSTSAFSAESGVPEMVTRYFPSINPTESTVNKAAMELTGGQGLMPPDASRDLKEQLSEAGVTWPEGSFVKYIPSVGRIIARNTPENMQKIEAYLEELNAPPIHIQIELWFVEYLKDDIEALSRQGRITADALMAMHKNGKSRLLAAPQVITQNGNEATVKGVTEYIYPTEFTVTPITGTDPGGSVSIIGGIAEPGSFETREVGCVLNIMPQVSPDRDRIALTLYPELVNPPEWKDYGAKKVVGVQTSDTSMEQPFFETYSSSSLMTLKNGVTAMISGGMNSRDGKKVVYVFVTAEIVDMEGRPAKPEGRVEDSKKRR